MSSPDTHAIRTFRDLVAWQRSMTLAETVYRATAELPVTERYGLSSQMQRAAVSVPSNIAEGFGKGTPPEFLRGLRVARGSLFELDTQTELCCRLGMLKDASNVNEILRESDRVLQGLIRSLESRTTQT